MRRIYIDRRHSQLSIKQGRLEVRWPGQQQLVHFPLQQLTAVVAVVHVQLSTAVLFELQHRGIDFMSISRRKGYSGMLLTSASHGHVKRQQKQAVLAAEPNSCLELAKRIVHSRLRQQHHLLKAIYRKRPDLAISMLNGMSQIAGTLKKVDQARTLKGVRGLEGAATASFFAAYQTAFAASLGFNKRKRRPPTDPVNALLSYTYTLVTKEAESILFSVGLNPNWGALHQLSYGRPSLACDLTELLRSRVERFVWRIFADQALRVHHFAEKGPECLLTKAGKQLYFPLYEQEAPCWRQLMRRIALRWVRELDQREVPEQLSLDLAS